MTKAKAKTLAAELIERGYAPQVRESAGVYQVLVQTGAGVSTDAIANIETLLTITAKCLEVQFE